MTTGTATAETKGFVVSFFSNANYSDGKTDCPNGLNPSAIDFYRAELAKVGHSHEEIEAVLKEFPGEGGLGQPWVPLVTKRGNGKDDIYIHPESMPDPGFIEVSGKYAYGFNLDGKGAASPSKFEDPETHELGVNNQLYKANGCIRSLRGLPPPGRAAYADVTWDAVRNVIPAWVIGVDAPNGFSKDGDVTVTFDRALERITRDTNGNMAQADMTYQVDPDPRSHNVLMGHLQGGVITTEAPDFFMFFDPYIQPDLKLTKAHFRLVIDPDGSARGILGGYQPWYTVYAGIAVRGYINEYASSVDMPAYYYALKRNADYDPDPKTGHNRQISSAYTVEAVPAYLVPAAGAPTTTAQAAETDAGPKAH
jgi:hypothetical protein